jgi:mRNA interferase MazF
LIRRGDIRWLEFRAPDKRRPVLVLGRPDVLPRLSQVPVMPLSGQVRGLAWEVILAEADGMPGVCVLKPEWIQTVPAQRLGRSFRRCPKRAGPRYGARA